MEEIVVVDEEEEAAKGIRGGLYRNSFEAS